jgi:two-component system sensor histidine kinase UhpB
MNLRFRLNLIVTLTLLVTLFIGALITIHNARETVRAEVSSTMDLALHMLDAELAHLNRSGYLGVTQQAGAFDLRRFSGVRHLRIDFYDNRNTLLETNQVSNQTETEQVPVWFNKQMESGLEDIESRELSVSINEKVIGKLVITPEPSSEIQEAWSETKTMLGLIALFFIAVNVVIYIAVAIFLKPINDVINALTDIETGHLDRRLPIFNLPELASISHKFNGMASALQLSIRNNHRLTQQIIRLQEAERKSLAHELHDEIGQHLTAIHVDAAAIRSCRNLDSAKQSAAAISEVVMQMMDIVRTMLHKLRPGGLDELGFVAALHELIDTWRLRHENVVVETTIDGEFSGLAESVQLTLYRVLQESLTNISRHSRADQVSIVVMDKPNQLMLSVSDNGQGFQAERHPQRFGLAGIRERVDSIDGQLEIVTGEQQGVRVEVVIPKQGENNESIN